MATIPEGRRCHLRYSHGTLGRLWLITRKGAIMKVGDKGLDFAYLPTTYAQMVKDGAEFFCRYSKGAGTSQSSLDIRTKPGEIAMATKLGADFLANFELSEGTPEEGAASGKKHGLADKDFWESRGLAPRAGVIISWETTDNHSKYPAVAAFINAYHSAIERPVGMYGPLNALRVFRGEGIIDFTWLPMSSSLSGINTSGMSQSQYAAKMEQVARDNGINLCQNRNRYMTNKGDWNVYTTATKIPFTHLQALGGDMPNLDETDLDQIESRIKKVFRISDNMQIIQFGQANNDRAFAILDSEIDALTKTVSVLAGAETTEAAQLVTILGILQSLQTGG